MEILIVEDDDAVLASFVKRFTASGFEVRSAGTVAAARAALQRHAFAAVVLDRTLPDGDGLVLCEELRKRDDMVPVLIVSGLSADDAQLQAYEAGVDTYVLKPTSAKVLVEQLRALIRRAEAPVRTAVGPITIDATLGALLLRGGDDELATVSLTPQELAFLRILAAVPNKVVERELLLAQMYGDDGDVSDNTLDKLASRIRAKLGPLAAHLQTVRGRGYRLSSVVEAPPPSE